MLIQPHESWNIYDASKIQAFMDCPRSYFYKYVLGWQPKAPNIHLEFGKAMHLAMEHLLIMHDKDQGYTEQAAKEAWLLLIDHYRKYFPPEMDEVYNPKNPEVGLKALLKYIQEYSNDKFKTLYTEIAGTVPINPSTILHFRMDSILKDSRGIFSREHKTGSTLSRQWTDQWALSMQTGVYNHVLYCLFPEESVWGVEINGIFLQKKECKFQRVPARRHTNMMNAWLYNVSAWTDLIKNEMDTLIQNSDLYETYDCMPCFPQNTQSCTKYFGCTYHDFCVAWSNPLHNLDRLPDNLTISYWNPMDEEREIKNIFDLKLKREEEKEG